MYDWPEVREATDALWAGISRRLGVALPLDRRADHISAWREPGLLFSQTCGYPFTHEFRGKLKLVATPHYGVEGCDGPGYCSFIMAREHQPLEALRGRRAAVNNRDSMSGMLALKLVFAPLAAHGQFFGEVIETGGHLRSLAAVRDGKADVCATDAVCVALARRYRPDELAGLVEIARSPMVPALPYVTHSNDRRRLQEALAGAFSDQTLGDARDGLFLTGFSVLECEAYDRITEIETEMEKAGGLKLL